LTNNELVDKAGKIRDGEELDLDCLRQYLEPVLGSAAASIEIKQFPGGFSNLTYLLSSGDEKWVLRRPPHGSTVKSAHDMSREFKILSALQKVYSYGPVPIHFCEDQEILGCDFYLMSYIEGLVIRREYPSNISLSPDQIRQQLFNFFDVLSELHSVDLVAAGLETFGKPEGYVKRQVEGWCKRWGDAVTPDTANFDATMQWLNDNMPAESGKASVIHNDYKLDNVIFSLKNPLNVIGVLDWEMATVGDPLMDLGCTLGYWVEMSDSDNYRQYRSMPSDSESAPTRVEIVARFQEKTGIAVDNFPFYFCFGVFRLAVIGQQIYYRYYQGLTKDERFAAMVKKVHVLQQMCSMIIAGKVSK
jgi:aminoglycoside phosphotransferase (APT) family kinase protein